MSDLEPRDFEDEPAIAVMRDDLVAALAARSRDDDTVCQSFGTR